MRQQTAATLSPQEKRALLAQLLQEKSQANYIYPLSYGQQALWFIYQSAPESAAYNMALPLHIHSELDIPALRQALQTLVDRHPALRTTFATRDGLPVQEVRAYQDVFFETIDSSAWTWTELRQEVAEAYRRPFDLGSGPVLRANLFTQTPSQHVLLLALHHIAGDATSFDILLDELLLVYSATQKGHPATLPPLPASHMDYVRWEADLLASPSGETLAAYWRDQLAGEIPILNLPADRPRPPVQTYNGATYAFHLTPGLSRNLKAFARTEKTTLFTLLLAAYQTFLYRYTGQRDIWVGVPTAAGRQRIEFAGLVGYLVNPVVLRAQFDPGNPSTFKALLTQVHNTVLKALVHQDYPFPLLVRQLQPERDLSYPPVFQVMFALQASSAITTSLQRGSLSISLLELAQMEGQFDLTLHIIEGEILSGSMIYNSDLFDVQTIARMAGHFEVLLKAIVAHPEQPIYALPLLSAPEQQQLQAWNATETDYPKDQTLVDLFERQVAQTSDNLAVVFEDQHLTYAELNARTNQLAHCLLSLKTPDHTPLIRPDTLVAICVERSLDMVVGLLGILKAGAAYVPIDPGYPAERIAFMLDDSAAPVLLTQTALQDQLPLAALGSARAVMCLDAIEGAAYPATNPAPQSRPESLAYVIYTSGSTGRPKGVVVEHQGLVLHARAILQHYGVTPTDKVLQFASFSFDISLEQCLLAWLSGACSVMASTNLMAAQDLLTLLQDQTVSVADFSPAYWQQMLETDDIAEALRHLRILILGGEALPPSLALQTRQSFPALTCFNSYGPTEAVIAPAVYRLPDILTCNTAYVPIGRPRANTRIHILDAHYHPLPPGIPGELCIAGAGLARGYLNRPALTAERFIEVELLGRRERVYKTGDLARWLPDGNLEYLGRLDHQVKLRGFRIELGEIEAVLAQHDAVREAVAVLYRGDDHPRLVAYVTAGNDVEAAALPAALTAHLQSRLPDYMVPAHIQVLEQLPLTPNGKVDRKALPAPETGATLGFEAPVTPTEELLAGLWAALLKRDAVGRRDHFFALGGHSLLATRLVARIRTHFRVELPIRSVFEHPEVAALARAIDQAAGGVTLPPIVPQPAGAPKVLSFAQQRLWFLAQWEGGAAATYNMPLALQLEGRLDVEALRATLVWLLARHESLRLCFPTVDGQAQVRVRPVDAGAALSVRDLTGLTAEAQPREVQRRADAHAVAPFEVDHGPLFKAELLVLAAERHVLLLNLHHLIGDGWSWGVLLRDWQQAYAAFVQGQPPPLPPPRLQYSDYAAWQREWLTGEVLQAQLDYWSTQLAHCPTVLELPTDHPRPPQQSYRGAHHRQTLSVALSTPLKRLSQQQGVTLFMTLLAAFNLLLARYSRQDDLCVGSPIANRTHHQTEDLIGFFVNTLVLRTHLQPEHSFTHVLDQTRETCLAAYAHQDLPFEALVEHLQPVRSLSHSPLFQVMFVLQNNDLPDLAPPGLAIEPLAQDYPIAKFDLTLSVEERDGQLHGVWEYATDLFAADTIARMAGHFEVLLEAIIANPEQPIHTLPLLTAPEQQQLQAWNATETDYPKDQTLVDLFEQQVEQTPDHLAVVFEDQHLSYAEFNARANRLAHYLLSLKATNHTPLIRPDTLVAICVERSLEMVVGLLGILKAGAAYVPLDPGYPAERLAFMLQDSAAPVLLTQTALKDQLPLAALGPACEVVYLDTLDGAAHPATNPSPQSRPVSLAYVIYTSGSTGRPKGVAVEHQGLVLHARAILQHYGVTPTDKVLQFASFGFDASLEQCLAAWLSGACLVMVKTNLIAAQDLVKLLQDQTVSVADFPPAYWQQMLETDHVTEALPHLRVLILGGEALPLSLAVQTRQHLPQLTCFNAYGPTEAVITPAVYRLPGILVESTAYVAIGRPRANTRIYVLDTHHHPLPPGLPGELCIAGAGLARGYLNRPELTAERFIEVDLFGATERIYKTGDLARWLPDGNLEYLGRLDHQVKLRGFRIELGEIEAVLAQHEAVREAVAVLYQGDGHPRLAAYVTVERDVEAAALPEVLKAHLQARLPDYMVPAHLQVLDTLPLTPNGKVDRKGLPAPETGATLGFEAPATPTEELLAGLWATLLKRDTVGRRDHFFALGGHSLLATRLVARIRTHFRVELPIRAVFEHPELAALAQAIDQAAGAVTLPPIVPQPGDAPQVLSFAQQRLWFLAQWEGESAATYHMPLALQLEGRLDVEALRASLVWLLTRHESLRQCFPTVDGQAQVRVRPVDAGAALSVHDLTGLTAEAEPREVQRRADAHAIAPFEVDHGPLFKAELLVLAAERHLLLLNLHHIIGDGWSWGVLLRDWQQAYTAFVQGQAPSLPPPRLQYSDYAAWQREWLTGEVLQAQVEYWTRQLADCPAVLELPTDHPRPPQPSYRGAHYRHTLSVALSARLQRLGRDQGATLFMTLLAAFGVLLARTSRQDDLCVGSPIANRTHHQTEDLIGFFVNTLVLRTRLEADPSFTALLV